MAWSLIAISQVREEHHDSQTMTRGKALFTEIASNEGRARDADAEPLNSMRLYLEELALNTSVYQNPRPLSGR